MKGNKISKNEKHAHAVIVCSVIGARWCSKLMDYFIENIHYEKNLNFTNLYSFLLEQKPYEESEVEKEIIERISEEEYENWKKSLKEPPLHNWKQITDGGVKFYQHCYPVLGEYHPDKRKIILYVKNMKKYIEAGTDVKKSELFNTVHLHELFHAYFHYVTEQKKCNYNYIFEIEEAMAEFCSLVCLNDLSVRDRNPKHGWQDCFVFAKNSIEEKQKEIGNLAAYGFGAYLFDNLYENEQYELINNYFKKIGLIDKDDDKVKEYCQKVRFSKYVPDKDNQKHCLNLLKEILEPTAN